MIVENHMRKRTADVHVLSEVVRRIIKSAQPEKIILFGSAVRGEMDSHSDLDLLVIVQPGTHRRQTAQTIYRNMIGVGHPVDVIVVTPEDIRRFGRANGLVLEPALREGKVVYERQAVTAG